VELVLFVALAGLVPFVALACGGGGLVELVLFVALAGLVLFVALGGGVGGLVELVAGVGLLLEISTSQQIIITTSNDRASNPPQICFLWRDVLKP